MSDASLPEEPSPAHVARRALALLDLTNLNDDCAAEDVDRLCDAARTPRGPVAAVCVWPRFVKQAKARLEGSGVLVATVANFPEGAPDAVAAASATAAGFADGADEVDVVIPWRRLADGDAASVSALLAACREATPSGRGLKAILETAALGAPDLVRDAARRAIAAGVDFIKTSTGKHPAGGASLDAAEIMLDEIAKAGGGVGFKASGGVKTTAGAAAYLAVADRLLGPDWARPGTFRFGASGLLKDLLAAIDA